MIETIMKACAMVVMGTVIGVFAGQMVRDILSLIKKS